MSPSGWPAYVLVVTGDDYGVLAVLRAVHGDGGRVLQLVEFVEGVTNVFVLVGQLGRDEQGDHHGGEDDPESGYEETLDDWHAARAGLAASTRRTCGVHIARYLKPRLGHLQVGQVMT